jgi:hypothetical protein
LLTGSLRITAATCARRRRGIGLTWTDAAETARRSAAPARALRRQRPDRALDLIVDPLSMLAVARIDTTITLRSTLSGGGAGTLSRWSGSVARRRTRPAGSR